LGANIKGHAWPLDKNDVKNWMIRNDRIDYKNTRVLLKMRKNGEKNLNLA